MLEVIAPTLERALGARTCVDQRTRHRPQVVTVMALLLQMTACSGVLVLLFAVEALMTVWNGCASGARILKSTMTPAGRTAFTRVCSWRRAIHVFYLGTVARSTSSPVAVSFAPERSLLRADVLAPASGTTFVELRNRLLVLSGPPLVTDQGRRSSSIGDAA
jgi:hypothetical protein